MAQELLFGTGNIVTQEASVVLDVPTLEVAVTQDDDPFVLWTPSSSRMSKPLFEDLHQSTPLGAMPFTPTPNQLHVPRNLQTSTPDFSFSNEKTISPVTYPNALPSFHIPPFHFPSPTPFPPSSANFAFRSPLKIAPVGVLKPIARRDNKENEAFAFNPLISANKEKKHLSLGVSSKPKISPSPRRFRTKEKKKYIPPFKRQQGLESVPILGDRMNGDSRKVRCGIVGKELGVVYTAAPPVTMDGSVPVGFKRRRFVV